MTPEQELAKIKTENFAGGTYYGRTPSGIVDLRTNQVVPESNQFGSNSPTSTIASSTVRRYTGTTTPATDGTYKTEADNFFTGLDITPPSEGEIAKIKEQSLADVQRTLDAIDASTATLLSDESVRATGRTGQGRSINARSGLIGSDMGERRAGDIEQINKGARESIINAQALKKAAVLDSANQRAATMAEAAKNDALKNADLYLQYMGKQQDAARADLKTLAGAGIDINTLGDKEYNLLLGQSGYDPLIFDAVYNASLPAQQKKTYHYENLGSGKVVRFDEKGGKPEYFDYSVPEGYSFKMAGDIPVFVNEKTQDIKIAGASEGGGVGDSPFGKETELDTFTDANGSRVSVMYNPATKKTRQVVLGKTGDAPGSFKPQAIEVSAVKQYLVDEGTKKGWSQAQIDKSIKDSQSNQQTFYGFLNDILNDKDLASRYYKPTTIGVPTGL